MERVSIGDGDREVSLAYVDSKVRALLREPYYSVDNVMDIDRVFKFLRQRSLKHSLFFVPNKSHYRAAVLLPLETPTTIETTNADPAIALGLLGARLAEIAGL